MPVPWVLLEKPDENPFLTWLYQDPPRYALVTQLFFLFQRDNEVRDLAQMDMFSTNTVAERTGVVMGGSSWDQGAAL